MWTSQPKWKNPLIVAGGCGQALAALTLALFALGYLLGPSFDRPAFLFYGFMVVALVSVPLALAASFRLWTRSALLTLDHSDQLAAGDRATLSGVVKLAGGPCEGDSKVAFVEEKIVSGLVRLTRAGSCHFLLESPRGTVLVDPGNLRLEGGEKEMSPGPECSLAYVALSAGDRALVRGLAATPAQFEGLKGDVREAAQAAGVTVVVAADRIVFGSQREVLSPYLRRAAFLGPTAAGAVVAASLAYQCASTASTTVMDEAAVFATAIAGLLLGCVGLALADPLLRRRCGASGPGEEATAPPQ
jgi:hypothetical protein